MCLKTTGIPAKHRGKNGPDSKLHKGMIVVDQALQSRLENDRPLKVGVVGCGFLGSALAQQIIDHMPGMELSCIATRTAQKALDVYSRSLRGEPAAVVNDLSELNQRIKLSRPSVTEDPLLMSQADGIEVILDASGSLEMGALVALKCIDTNKHLVLINAELDATVGPILYHKAKQKGLIITGTDGDQPGTQLNLLRFVRTAGLKPLVAGNIKGLQDHYRTPDTQKAFAAEWGQNPWMVTSFADGTKISFEQALVANATGFRVSQRGMIGMAFKGHVDELTTRYNADELKALNGIVDYVVGPQPGPGVYVIALEENPNRQHYLKYFKMGTGPLYCFYTPYHLCHLEAPISAARAALLGDEVVSPSHGPIVDVITMAKRPLKAGEKIDAIGGFCTYGVCENADVTYRDRLVPVGLAEGCVLKHDLPMDSPLTWNDVITGPTTILTELRREQEKHFMDSAG